MVRIISFEGCVGAGKTSLTNYFSCELKYKKILEEYEKNPFLKDFYKGVNVYLETEITFLLIHYSQLKNVVKLNKSDFILCDFSIEKDFVYAKLNLSEEKFKVFKEIYDYVVKQIGVPYMVIYLDLSLNIIKRRIFQRERPYEINADSTYFKNYNDKVKAYFTDFAHSKVYLFNVDDLDLDYNNKKVRQIKNKILEAIKDA